MRNFKHENNYGISTTEPGKTQENQHVVYVMYMYMCMFKELKQTRNVSFTILPRLCIVLELSIKS